jgi:hypothetical protein
MDHQIFFNLHKTMGGFYYLDPGSGSILLQMLLAAILGIGVAVRLFWGKIRSFFTRKSLNSDKSTEE